MCGSSRQSAGAAGKRAGLSVGRRDTGCTVVGAGGAMRRGGRHGRGQVSPALGVTRLEPADWSETKQTWGYRFLLLTASDRRRRLQTNIIGDL